MLNRELEIAERLFGRCAGPVVLLANVAIGGVIFGVVVLALVGVLALTGIE